MRFNEFNSKINLPELCRTMGIKGLKFIKLPTFGWFAFNSNRTQIAHIFQLFSDEEAMALYRKLVLDRPDVHEFTMLYSEYDQQSLYTDYLKIRFWRSIYTDSLSEAESNYIKINDKKRKLKD